MSHRDQALPVTDQPPADSPSAIGPDIKVVSSAPPPVVRPAAASHPLAAIKAMSEEEKIALFT